MFVIPEKVQQFGYESLELATGGFNPTLYSAGGNLIGTGGFGQVFIGKVLCKVRKFKKSKKNTGSNPPIQTFFGNPSLTLKS